MWDSGWLLPGLCGADVAARPRKRERKSPEAGGDKAAEQAGPITPIQIPSHCHHSQGAKTASSNDSPQPQKIQSGSLHTKDSFPRQDCLPYKI